jgi:hypothetical protein
MESHQGEFFRRGGIAKSDTVPAMLTPGEYVVNKTTVDHFGSGFFESLNNLSLPVQSIAAQVQGYASGGLVSQTASAITRPDWSTNNTPSRTVRVELVSGDRKVHTTIDARDENHFLQVLNAAKARAL